MAIDNYVEGNVQVNAGSGGPLIDAATLPNGNTRQIVTLGDPNNPGEVVDVTPFGNLQVLVNGTNAATGLQLDIAVDTAGQTILSNQQAGLVTETALAGDPLRTVT